MILILLKTCGHLFSRLFFRVSVVAHGVIPALWETEAKQFRNPVKNVFQFTFVWGFLCFGKSLCRDSLVSFAKCHGGGTLYEYTSTEQWCCLSSPPVLPVHHTFHHQKNNSIHSIFLLFSQSCKAYKRINPYHCLKNLIRMYSLFGVLFFCL